MCGVSSLVLSKIILFPVNGEHNAETSGRRVLPVTLRTPNEPTNCSSVDRSAPSCPALNSRRHVSSVRAPSSTLTAWALSVRLPSSRLGTLPGVRQGPLQPPLQMEGTWCAAPQLPHAQQQPACRQRLPQRSPLQLPEAVGNA